MLYNYNINSDSNRKSLQKKALDIYECNYIEHVITLLKYRYEKVSDRLMRYCDPTRNVLRRTAQAQSVLYARPPRLITSPDAATAELIRDYVPGLYPALEEVQTLTCALMDMFVWPYWDTYDNCVKLQLVPPHVVDVYQDQETVVAVRVLIEPVDTLKAGSGRYRVWTRNYWWDSSSSDDWHMPKPNEAVNVNPLGLIPVVWFRMAPATVGRVWGIFQNLDLINGTIEIGEMETLHNKVNYLRSFRQASVNVDQFTSGSEPKAGDLQIAPDTILPYKVDSTALADESDSYLKSIREVETDLAASRGISAKAYFKDNIGKDETSSISEELKQRWYKQIKIFADPERQLYKIIAKLISKNTSNSIPDDTKYRIDYIEPVEFTDPEASLRALKASLELNLTSIEDYIYKTNPEYNNIDEVKELITNNMESRVNVMQYLRAHNMPSDPTQLGQDPELNGANGPKLVQNSFDNNSLEFNQKANDPRGVTL